MGSGSWPWAGVGLAGVVVFAGSCANRSEAVIGTIGESRVVEHTDIQFKTSASHAERFGLVASSRSAEARNGGAADRLHWRTPAGWTELPPSSMRVANFRPGGDAAAECYLSALSGDAGGLAANVNRWRAQLSLGALSAQEVEALPRARFFGRDATVVEGAGSWKGMSDASSRSGWALLGLVLVEPESSLFLKMTGPADVIAAEREHFLELAGSFDDQRGSETAPTSSSSGFRYELPDSWRPTDAKATRALSFYAGEGQAVECYVTVLGGTAGGELANVNRWRAQLGLEPVDSAALDALESFSILGRPAHVVELDGPGSSLLGITCLGDDRSVFVKMTGPADAVRAQRANLLRFAGSLKDKP